MGLFSSKAWDPTTQIPNLEGKVAIVTGANTGMGYSIAENLALNGATVYMGARSETKAKFALEKFKSAHEASTVKGSLIWLPLDLTTPDDVMKAVEIFSGKEKRLDILVNNACRAWSPYILTKDGLETSVAINHIGHFTLVRALLPLLTSTSILPNSSVRIVTVSSGAHAFISSLTMTQKSDLNISFAPNPSSPDSANATKAQARRYFFTKLLNILFASELQRRLDAEKINITSISLDPGLTWTKGEGSTSPSENLPFWMAFALKWFGKAPLVGATSALFAATSVEVGEKGEVYKGAYLGPGGKLAVPNETSRSVELARSLWDVSEGVVKEALGEVQK